MRSFAIAPLLIAAALSACSSIVDAEDPPLSRAVAPRCASPAPLDGSPAPQFPDSYLVVFHDGTPPAATTERLASKYGFEPKYVYQYVLQGFAATLTPQAVAGIRCEREVHHVSYDAVITIAG